MSRRILIVDDNPTNLRLAASVLELEGFAVEQAADATQAIERLETAVPDLVLMDIALPGMDGLALTRRIKADPRWSRVPVVALTAFAMKGDELKALEAGCCGYLTKPIDTRTFAAEISRHFAPRGPERLLIVDDHPTNLRLLRAQLEAEGIEVFEARHGVEALQVLRDAPVTGVISDILMPQMDGYRLCLEVRRDPDLSRLPIVLYTSTYDSAADRELALAAGADAYLSKPAPVADLLAALEQARGRAQSPAPAPAELESPVLQQYSEALVRKLEEKNLELGAAYEGLAEAQARLSGLVESALDAIIVLDSEQRIILFNAAAELMFGCRRETALGGSLDSMIPQRFRGRHPGWIEEFGAGARDQRPMSARVVWARRADGTEFPTEASISRLMTSGGWLFTVFLRDITQRHRAQQALASSEARLRRMNRVLSVLSGINTLIVRVDRRDTLLEEACRIAVEAGSFPKAWIGLVEEKSQRLEFAAGHGAEAGYFEALRARLREQDAPQHSEWMSSLEALRPIVVNDVEREPRMLPEAISSQSRSLAALPLEIEGRAAGVLVIHADETGFFDEEEISLLGDLADDISHALAHLRQAERLDYLARFDALTGLPNRSLFAERLNERLEQIGDENGTAWIVMLDLARFRRINDTFGRAAGDQLLQQFASRLQQCCPNAARINGDLFAFKLTELEGVPAALHALDTLLDRCTREPYPIDGQQLRLDCRAGVATYPGDGQSVEVLMGNAEAALRQARANNEPRAFYSSVMNARAADALAVENRLRQASTQREFVLHYQPKMCLGSGRICGVEALIRWQDPSRGLISPGLFIPVLEETGLIVEVGQWALDQALSDQEVWRQTVLQPPPVAVNVSPLQLRREGFVERVLELLGRWPHASLEIEITETVIMQEMERSIDKLLRLREAGLGIAVDDFGTGYSSLAYVARLPLTALKIDRSFVQAMDNGANAMAIASSIVALGHALHLTVVAEGVETRSQEATLLRLGCDEAQGFLYSRPVPAETLARLLAEQDGRPSG